MCPVFMVTSGPKRKIKQHKIRNAFENSLKCLKKGLHWPRALRWSRGWCRPRWPTPPTRPPPACCPAAATDPVAPPPPPPACCLRLGVCKEKKLQVHPQIPLLWSKIRLLS